MKQLQQLQQLQQLTRQQQQQQQHQLVPERSKFLELKRQQQPEL
jgi:hypothetical protein